jgi:molecular chaperone HscB
MLDFSRNYFELFGMSAGFLVDVPELARRYRELQKVVHPDRFAAAGQASQRLSLQSATLVNEAYDTLKDPLKRAQYLLRLRGVELDAQHHTLNDPDFLMQQMTLREALAEMRGATDARTRLEILIQDIGNLIETQVARLAVELEESGAEQLEAAVQSVQKMQFLNKLHAEAEALEAELEEAY